MLSLKSVKLDANYLWHLLLIFWPLKSFSFNLWCSLSHFVMLSMLWRYKVHLWWSISSVSSFRVLSIAWPFLCMQTFLYWKYKPIVSNIHSLINYLLEKGMANHSSMEWFWSSPETVWKGKKKIDTRRWATQGGRCPICYWRRAEK